MKKLTKQLTAILLAAALVLSLTIANVQDTFAEESPDSSQVAQETAQTAQYLLDTLNAAEITVFNYKEILLIMRSGIDYGDLAERYLNLLESNITDGKLVFEDSENPTIYAAYLIILAICGDNPSENDMSMIHAFNNVLASYTDATELNNAIGNPYYYDFIIPAVFAYSDYMEDSDTIKPLLCDAIMTNYDKTDEGCGINYWGFSCDNNAAVLPALNYFSDNEEIATAVANAVEFNESLIMEDGGSRFDNGEYSTASNADSTGAALYLYSILGNKNAASSYEALINFKSATTPGAFTYYGEDNMYATVDALKGLVAYTMSLNHQGAPFDVTKEAAELFSTEEPTEITETVTETDTVADTEADTKANSEADTSAAEDTTIENSATGETAVAETTAETTTAANAATNTGDSTTQLGILLLLCIISAGTIALAHQERE